MQRAPVLLTTSREQCKGGTEGQKTEGPFSFRCPSDPRASAGDVAFLAQMWPMRGPRLSGTCKWFFTLLTN